MPSMPNIYFSFFMFSADMQMDNPEFVAQSIAHMQALHAMGYTGFELPIARSDPNLSSAQEVALYTAFRQQMDSAGLSSVAIATNVGTTPEYDPTSFDPQVRQAALDYLKSRVDITEALRGEIMMGPLVLPYGGFLNGITGNHTWSDELQNTLDQHYTNAQPILNSLGEYALTANVKIAIEPITHWETVGPNKLSQLIGFLGGVASTQVGVVIDSAHETLDGDGPVVFAQQVKQLSDSGRLHYAQVSPPDRGDLTTSWLPWEPIFSEILDVYNGPIAVEIFNTIPAFTDSMRLTRRKYWIPGVDMENEYPSAYQIAESSLATTLAHFDSILGDQKRNRKGK